MSTRAKTPRPSARSGKVARPGAKSVAAKPAAIKPAARRSRQIAGPQTPGRCAADREAADAAQRSGQTTERMRQASGDLAQEATRLSAAVEHFLARMRAA